MSCNNCGSKKGCGCKSSCQSSSCGPVPYYETTPLLCPEDNSKIVNNIMFSTVIKSSTPFNMPACGQEVQVFFNDLYQIAPYSRLWSFGIGFLTVLGFNPDTGALILRNDCDTSCGEQAPAGTYIAECTSFTVGAASCNTATPSEANEFPYLAAQFTIPADGDCIDISVTNVNGLIANTNVQIGGYTYLLDEIKSPTVIRICNNGAGGVPGTIVNATDSNGNYITPIILVDTNPCTRDPAFSGKLIVCTAGGQFPLAGTGTNQVPVLDYATGEVQFKTLALPTVACSTLTACLVLDPAHVGSYLVQVLDTSNFDVGDTLTVGTTVVTVDSIDSATTMRVTPVDPVVAIINYPIGTAICGADCCTTIIDDIADIIEDACVPQVQYLPITLQIVTINGGGAVPYAASDGNAGAYYYETVIEAANFNLAGGCTWAVEGIVDVAVSMAVGGSGEPDCECTSSVLNEIECVWNTGFAPTRTTGKSIWNQGIAGDWSDIAPNYPGNSTFVAEQLLPVSPGDSQGYHGAQMIAIATQLPASTNMILRVFFKSALPTATLVPLTVTGLQIMISGFIKVYRV